MKQLFNTLALVTSTGSVFLGGFGMRTPAYLRAFKAYLASSPGFFDLPAMELEFYGNISDRAAVILQVSSVENILKA